MPEGIVYPTEVSKFRFNFKLSTNYELLFYCTN